MNLSGDGVDIKVLERIQRIYAKRTRVNFYNQDKNWKSERTDIQKGIRTIKPIS